VLAALLIILLMGMVALALDLGYIVLVRTQLQVAADSAAMAGAAQMIESIDDVIATAQEFADHHFAGNKHVELNSGDVEFGFWNFQTRQFSPAASNENAVRVMTRRDETAGGEAPLFFAKALGIDSCAVRAEATAAFVNNFVGFNVPPPDESLSFLPLALDQETCQGMLAGIGTDDWGWNADLKQVTSRPDGSVEVNLYPEDTGEAGNRGTVDIGNPNNSTADIERQILHGVTAEDLSFHGGKLELGDDGVLELNGDTGISAGLKDALEAIVGKPQIIPIFSEVNNPGNNAQYSIVGFAGVRIVEVELTGNNKRVMIQPARVFLRGGIPAPDETPSSHYIFSPVCLVR
jgi:hypothetical protein